MNRKLVQKQKETHMATGASRQFHDVIIKDDLALHDFQKENKKKSKNYSSV